MILLHNNLEIRFFIGLVFSAFKLSAVVFCAIELTCSVHLILLCVLSFSSFNDAQYLKRFHTQENAENSHADQVLFKFGVLHEMRCDAINVDFIMCQGRPLNVNNEAACFIVKWKMKWKKLRSA